MLLFVVVELRDHLVLLDEDLVVASLVLLKSCNAQFDLLDLELEAVDLVTSIDSTEATQLINNSLLGINLLLEQADLLHRLLLSVVEGTLERILETTFLALVHVNSLLFIGEQLVNSPSLVILELLVFFDF